MRRISLVVLAVLALLTILALPAMAQYDDYGYNDDDYGYNGDDDYGRDYNDDDYGNDDYGRDDDRYDEYPPGYYDDPEEPREPRCDWYYFDETRQYDAWWEYWCRWPGWGWVFVVWEWA